MNKTLLEQFAEKAEQKAQSRLEMKTFSLAGIDTPFKQLSHSEKLEYFEALIEAGTNAAKNNNVCKQMIYDCCPTLQDEELIKTLGVVDPYDIVPKLLDIAEIDDLGSKLLKWQGIIKEDNKVDTEQIEKN